MRADLSIIETLAYAYPAACSVQDWDGKTPLHLACDGGCNLFDSEVTDEINIRKPNISVVSTLIHACPQSVRLDDHDGMNALEHAILSDASVNVVQLLQRTTSEQFKKCLADT